MQPALISVMRLQKANIHNLVLLGLSGHVYILKVSCSVVWIL